MSPPGVGSHGALGPSRGSPRSAMHVAHARAERRTPTICASSVAGVSDAGEVGHRRQRGLAGDAAGDPDRACRAWRRPRRTSPRRTSAGTARGRGSPPELLAARLVACGGKNSNENERSPLRGAAGRWSAGRACRESMDATSYDVPRRPGGGGPPRPATASLLGSARDQHRTCVGPAAFRERVQEALDAFLDGAGRPGWRRSATTRPGCWPRRGRRCRAASASVRRSATGDSMPSPSSRHRRTTRAGAGLRGARATPRERPGPRRLHGRLRHPPRPPRDAPRLRRRAPARTGWRGDPEQYGASAAILLGDLLLSWSDELLRRCGLPLDRVAAALDVFDRCRSEVIAGQFLDVSVQARGVADVDAAMTVLRYKSAKYSVERPLHIGATLAGGSETAAGRALGVRAAAGRGLPAPRRPARRLRRPVDDRQAGRRRPDRGQADRAGRARPGRRAGRRRRPASTRPSGHRLAPTEVGRAAPDHRRLRRPPSRSRR